jgi:glycosyltransferase involved in cell wall biosynthesis
LQEASGNQDGFPEQSDPQDHVYVPAARHGVPARFPASAAVGLPTLSVVTPSFNQAAYLGAAIESVLAQEYPNLEALVFDGGSTDGSVDVLDGLASHLAYWESRPDRGPAHAINKGLVRSSGEVVGWLNSDDVLAPDALWHVAKAFAADPDLDLVYGNALYVDERQELFLADHGCWKTGFYFGDMQPRARIPAYWEYVHAVPQPTVFFRRRLLDRWGLLDESFHFIFDFELFFRFSQGAKIRKLERTLALYRIHSASKTSDWNKFLVELYRFSRPWWPRVFQREFRNTLRGFLRAYARRRCGPRLSSVRSWGMLALVAAMAATGKGNPEALGGPRPL